MLILPAGRNFLHGLGNRIADQSAGFTQSSFIDFRNLERVTGEKETFVCTNTDISNLGAVFDGSGSGRITGLEASIESSAVHTLVVMATAHGYGASGFGRIVDSSDERYRCYLRSSSPYIRASLASTSTNLDITTWQPTFGKPFIVALIIDGTSRYLKVIDVGSGVLHSASEVNSLAQTYSDLIFGNRPAFDREFDGILHFALGDSRVIKDEALIELAADPWRYLYRSANNGTYGIATAATGGPTLSVADTVAAQLLDGNLSLVQAHTLSVADSAAAQAAENVALQVGVTLVVADTAAAQALDGLLSLVQAYTLTVADSSQAQSADGIMLQLGLVLSVQDAASAQLIDGLLALVQAGTLTVADVSQAQALDPVVLQLGGVTLAVADAVQSQLLDGPITLSTADVLAVHDSAQAQTIDGNLSLTQANILIVADTLAAQVLPNLGLIVGELETPAGRLIIVPAEVRVITIPAADGGATIN